MEIETRYETSKLERFINALTENCQEMSGNFDVMRKKWGFGLSFIMAELTFPAYFVLGTLLKYGKTK